MVPLFDMAKKRKKGGVSRVSCCLHDPLMMHAHKCFLYLIYRCCRQETLYSSVSDCSVCTIFPSLCLTYKFLLCHQDLPCPWWRTSHRTKEMSHCRLCVPLPRRGNIPCSLGQRHIRLWHGDRLCWVLICRGLQYDSYSRSAHSPSSSDIVSARKKTLQCDSL